MPLLYYANVTIHVLAAMFWLGSMLFLGLIGAPVLRAVDPPALRQRLFQDMGLRFRSAGWWTIAVLLATGVINLYSKGWLRCDGVFGSLDFWRTTVGHTLALKLATVAMMMTVSAVHDFVLGPLAGRAIPGSDEAIVLRRRAARVARANALLGVLIVAIAVRLARGG